MKRLIYSLIILLTIAGCSQFNKQKNSISTPIEQSDFKRLTSYSDMIRFLEKSDSLSRHVSLDYIGKSAQGKDIPIVKISEKGKLSKEHVNVLLFAQQDGREPSGKEGLLLLIRDLVNGENDQWLNKLNLLIIPQVNPDGAENDQSKNANGVNLKKDHLLLKAKETRLIHRIFDQYKPEVAIDVQEYSPYADNWVDFGYIKNFDIQIGGTTNINVDSSIVDLYDNKLKPFVEDEVTEQGYSFFEYTYGNLPAGDRLRKGSVKINEARQSFGILNTLSFMIKGKKGKEPLDELKRRCQSQYVTSQAIIDFVYEKQDDVKQIVDQARNKLNNSQAGEKVGVRMKHEKGRQPLNYPLESMNSGNDTTFVVEEYHSKIISTLNVDKPSAYLINQEDKKLIQWLDRNNIAYYKYDYSEDHEIKQYRMLSLRWQTDENFKNYYPEVKQIDFTQKKVPRTYLYVPVDQLSSNKVVTALEPQSMIGLVNTSEFEYLVKKHRDFPVLKLFR